MIYEEIKLSNIYIVIILYYIASINLYITKKCNKHGVLMIILMKLVRCGSREGSLW